LRDFDFFLYESFTDSSNFVQGAGFSNPGRDRSLSMGCE